MAIGLPRQRSPEPTAQAVGPRPLEALGADSAPISSIDRLEEILQRLEAELAAMVQRLDPTANSAAANPDATLTPHDGTAEQPSCFPPPNS